MSTIIYNFKNILSNQINAKKIGSKIYKEFLETENNINIEFKENIISVDIPDIKNKLFLNKINIKGGVVLKFNKDTNIFNNFIKNNDYCINIQSMNLSEFGHKVSIFIMNPNKIYDVTYNNNIINSDNFENNKIYFRLDSDKFFKHSILFIIIYSESICRFEIKNFSIQLLNDSSLLDKSNKLNISKNCLIDNKLEYLKNTKYILYCQLNNEILFPLSDNRNIIKKSIIKLNDIFKDNFENFENIKLNDNKFILEKKDIYNITLNGCIIIDDRYPIENCIKYKISIQIYDKDWENIKELFFVDYLNKNKTISHFSINGYLQNNKINEYRIIFNIIDNSKDNSKDNSIILYNGIVKINNI